MMILRFSLLCLLLFYSTIIQSQNLKIYHIDVEQGDATLFISPNGSTLLVDAGRNNHGTRIKYFLEQENISTIDHFVVTHYHDDHYGGIDELYNDPDINVVNSYDRGDKEYLPASKLRQSNYINYINSVGENARPLYRGDEINLDPSMTVTCLSKGGVVLGETNPDYAGIENDMSVSLLIQYGNFHYFIGGDIHSKIENKIAERQLAVDVDVYQANHHGSHSSSSTSFIENLLPNVVIISNGNSKRYGHPRKSTLENLANLSSQPTIFQTNKFLADNDRAGNVPDQFISDLTTTSDKGSILLEVSDNLYVISYRDQSHTFNIKNRTVASNSMVIKSLIPNPVGSDLQLESVTLLNRSNQTIDLSSWYLLDASAKRWSLRSIGDLKANDEIMVLRKGRAMSLNNKGDFIILLNGEEVIDKFQYHGSTEGEVITTGH